MFGRLPTERANLLGVCIEGFFFGIYTAIFHLFYLICILYVLSIVTVVGDTMDFIVPILFAQYDHLLHWSSQYLDSTGSSLIPPLAFLQITVTGFCDFLAQFILIYRCWVAWSRNIRVIIIPSILAIAFLGFWLTNNSSWHFSPSGKAIPTSWGSTMLLTGLTLSLIVNAFVTGLIVLRIFTVYREVKPTSKERTLGATPGGRKLRSIMFILIESGMSFFSMRLVRLVLCLLSSQNAAMQGYDITLGIDQMLHGIIPTIILVRVSMGLSFHDDESMVEATTTSKPDHSLGSVTVVQDPEEISEV